MDAKETPVRIREIEPKIVVAECDDCRRPLHVAAVKFLCPECYATVLEEEGG